MELYTAIDTVIKSQQNEGERDNGNAREQNETKET